MAMRAKKMSRSKLKRNFKKGLKIHPKNRVKAHVRRGGYRL